MKGTPHFLKCPRCRCGTFGSARAVQGVKPTGRVEPRIRKSAHSGSGYGGSGFRGHRGEVRCGDCGHTWYSTHPRSGRIACDGGVDCPAHG